MTDLNRAIHAIEHGLLKSKEENDQPRSEYCSWPWCTGEDK